MKPLDSLLTAYKEKPAEIIFEWNDSQTNARGWIVINSLRGGAAGGGTRMRKGLTMDEVLSLAKVMEIKFSVCGPNIGGAKSGIDFDPKDPRRQEVLERWYKAAIPILKTYYGTGGDLNVDEIKDVVPITEDLGLWHPQEGIVNGHLKPSEGERINILGQLRYGVSKTIEDQAFVPQSENKYAIADMVTGYGVAESVRHYYDLYKGETIKDKKVIIQGWGNVAAAAGYYLSKIGAKIVGIIDKEGSVINHQGFTYDEIENLFISKKNNALNCELIDFETSNNIIWDVPCDIFIPGAASKLITRNQVDKLLANGCEVISCGANVPFVDDGVFFGPTAHYVDESIALIPDFIANCGMARVFAYLMQSDVEITDKAILNDVSETIYQALRDVKAAQLDRNRISLTAMQIALNKIM